MRRVTNCRQIRQLSQALRAGLSNSVIALCLFASGCGSTPAPEPVVRTVDVNMAIPTSCVPPSLAPAPTFGDSRAALLAAPSAEDRFQLMSSNWFPRDVRLRLLESVVAECRQTKALAPP
jgi:hypothetical protein